MIDGAKLSHLNWVSPHPTNENGVLVDPDLMYPAILTELGVAREEYDQYWLEVAFQCMKLIVQRALDRMNVTIHVRGDDGRAWRWRHAAFPPGKGSYAAVKQFEARGFFFKRYGTSPMLALTKKEKETQRP